MILKYNYNSTITTTHHNQSSSSYNYIINIIIHYYGATMIIIIICKTTIILTAQHYILYVYKINIDYQLLTINDYIHMCHVSQYTDETH